MRNKTEAVTITEINEEATCCNTRTFVDEEAKESLKIDTIETNNVIKNKK